MLKIRT